MGFVYFPHGAVEKFWAPKGTGKGFEFSPILKPMEARARLRHAWSPACATSPAKRQNPPHGITEQTWLTCRSPQPQHLGPGGRHFDRPGRSRRQIGQDTPLSSLELCGGARRSATSSTALNRSLPLEGNPRKVFYGMFGPGDSNADRVARLNATDSLLDYVLESSKSLNRKLGAADRALVNDYLESVREVEGRVSKLMAKADSLGDLPDAPRGTPDDFTELVDVQFEMIALAFQTGQTRVASLRMIKEASMRTFPSVQRGRGLPPAVAPWRGSGQAGEAACACRPTRSSASRSSRRSCQSIKEGDDNLLDNSMILYGSNLATRDLHNCSQLPQLIAGQGWRHQGRPAHLPLPKDTPHANILLTMAQRAGVKLERFGDATGTFSEA